MSRLVAECTAEIDIARHCTQSDVWKMIKQLRRSTRETMAKVACKASTCVARAGLATAVV